MSKQIKKKVKVFSLRLLVFIIVFFLALFLFGFIANEMVIEHENGLDRTIFQKIAVLDGVRMTGFMTFITFFGSSYFLLPAYFALIVYFLVFRKNWKSSIDIAAIGITSTILLFSLKYLFQRQRPLSPLINKVAGFSFPSGHSFSSFTFFGLLIYLLWKHDMDPLLRWLLTLLFFLFGCLIAFSRVYLRVHYPSDVVAGFCLCIVWLGISFWVLKKFDRKLS